MNNESIRIRAKDFLAELELPVTAFGRRVKLSRSAYYAWQAGDLDLSAETLSRIDDFLKRYGF